MGLSTGGNTLFGTEEKYLNAKVRCVDVGHTITGCPLTMGYCQPHLVFLLSYQHQLTSSHSTLSNS